jgi:glycosyltransferase involved in cell wall biosynthesis
LLYIKMRVLFLTPGFAAHEHDLNCIPPLQLFVRALMRQGVDLHIIALEYPFRGAPYRWGGVDEAGVYPCNGRNRRYLRWRTLARARSFARQLLTEKRFDVIHSFWLGPAWALGEQLAARWQTPHFSTLMGQDVLPANRYLRRLRAEAASRLVALTSFHNDVLEKTTGLRAAHCIPWGVAKSDIPVSLPAKRPVDVLGVGSLVPVKNWEQWLRVLHLAVAERPGLSALLIGAGPEEGRLRALANRLHLENNLQFAGEIPRPEVLARMRESRVLLHTARFESFGMVLAEAAAHGCRAVGTPVGIAPALGLCADADTTLATALLQALEAPVLTAAPNILSIEATVEGYLRMWPG